MARHAWHIHTITEALKQSMLARQSWSQLGTTANTQTQPAVTLQRMPGSMLHQATAACVVYNSEFAATFPPQLVITAMPATQGDQGPVTHLECWPGEPWGQGRVHVLGVHIAQLLHQQLDEINL